MTRFRNPHFCARKSAPQSQLLSRSVSAQHISGILTRFPCSAEQECVSGHKNRVAHLPQKLRIQFLEGVDGAAPSHNPPTVRARAAREDKNALSCSPWNSPRPSCTIGSSGLSMAVSTILQSASLTAPFTQGSLWVLCLIVFCFSCILAETFSFQREDGEYSDLRSGNVAFPRPRPTFSWSPQWRPFGQTALLFLAAASRAQLRANGLKTFVLSSPAQYRISVRGRELHVFRCV